MAGFFGKLFDRLGDALLTGVLMDMTPLRFIYRIRRQLAMRYWLFWIYPLVHILCVTCNGLIVPTSPQEKFSPYAPRYFKAEAKLLGIAVLELAATAAMLYYKDWIMTTILVVAQAALYWKAIRLLKEQEELAYFDVIEAYHIARPDIQPPPQAEEELPPVMNIFEALMPTTFVNWFAEGSDDRLHETLNKRAYPPQEE